MSEEPTTIEDVAEAYVRWAMTHLQTGGFDLTCAWNPLSSHTSGDPVCSVRIGGRWLDVTFTLRDTA